MEETDRKIHRGRLPTLSLSLVRSASQLMVIRHPNAIFHILVAFLTYGLTAIPFQPPLFSRATPRERESESMSNHEKKENLYIIVVAVFCLFKFCKRPKNSSIGGSADHYTYSETCVLKEPLLLLAFLISSRFNVRNTSLSFQTFEKS